MPQSLPLWVAIVAAAPLHPGTRAARACAPRSRRRAAHSSVEWLHTPSCEQPRSACPRHTGAAACRRSRLQTLSLVGFLVGLCLHKTAPARRFVVLCAYTHPHAHTRTRTRTHTQCAMTVPPRNRAEERAIIETLKSTCVCVREFADEIKRRTPDARVYKIIDIAASLFENCEISLYAFCTIVKACAPEGVAQQVVTDLVQTVITRQGLAWPHAESRRTE